MIEKLPSSFRLLGRQNDGYAVSIEGAAELAAKLNEIIDVVNAMNNRVWDPSKEPRIVLASARPVLGDPEE